MAYMRITSIDSYEKLDQWIGNRQTKEVAYKTVARRETTYVIANATVEKRILIRQWNTDIYSLNEQNIATLDVGAWYTVTTKQRIVDLLPQGLTIDSVKGRWYLVRIAKILSSTNPGRVGEYTRIYESVFYNGMRINVATGQLVDYDTAKKAEAAAFVQDAKNNATRRKIRNYVNGLSDDVVNRLAGEGTLGDCMFCGLERSGESYSDDHLISHLDEKYYLRTLFMNATAKRGNPYICATIPSIVRHDLGKYLRKRLLKGVAVA